MQAGAAHDAIHQEGRARHVAQILEQEDEEEQDHDLRQEHDHAADTADQTVLQEALQQIGQRQTLDEVAEEMEDRLDRIHAGLRPGEDRLEHHEQDREQHDQPRHRMQKHGVDAGGQAVGLAEALDHGSQDTVSLALGAAQGGGVGRGPQGAGRGLCRFKPPVDLGQQRVGAAAAHRDRTHHGQAEFATELLGVDLDAALARDIHHVERQHDRTTDLLQLQHQTQRQTQVGRVGDTHDQVGGHVVLRAAQHDVARHLFVGRAGAQRIGAGQVHDAHRAAGRGRQWTDLLFDGDAGIVGDLLPAAGQRIEQGRLAAIGIADQRNHGRANGSGDGLGGGLGDGGCGGVHD